MLSDAQISGAAKAHPLRAHFVIPATFLDVRQGLLALMASALVQNLPEDSHGTTELALAEALNNVVEHAYATYSGQIEISVQREPHQLHVQIIDTGLPLPGAQPPYCDMSDTDTIADLPEGGFGWCLIRSLVQNLTYGRERGRNMLTFGIAVVNQSEFTGLVPQGSGLIARIVR